MRAARRDRTVARLTMLQVRAETRGVLLPEGQWRLVILTPERLRLTHRTAPHRTSKSMASTNAKFTSTSCV